jgi:hypothetical protein
MATTKTTMEIENAGHILIKITDPKTDKTVAACNADVEAGTYDVTIKQTAGRMTTFVPTARPRAASAASVELAANITDDGWNTIDWDKSKWIDWKKDDQGQWHKSKWTDWKKDAQGQWHKKKKDENLDESLAAGLYDMSLDQSNRKRPRDRTESRDRKDRKEHKERKRGRHESRDRKDRKDRGDDRHDSRERKREDRKDRKDREKDRHESRERKHDRHDGKDRKDRKDRKERKRSRSSSSSTEPSEPQ